MERPSLLERLRAFNRWTKGWAGSVAVAVGIWIVLRSYLIEAFRIPSASMENTLLIGDFLFVNKAIYGGELEIPLTGIRCCHVPGYAEPQRDGIVVFRSVEDSTPNLNIVKRVIGGPTDTLQMTHDRYTCRITSGATRPATTRPRTTGARSRFRPGITG